MIAYTKENLYDRDKVPQTLEDYQNWFAVYKTTMKRQHGRAGISNDNPEQELNRLKSNYKSIICRKRQRELDKAKDEAFKKSFSKNTAKDKYGLTAKEERMYTSKFRNSPIGSPVLLSYMKRMTGFDLDTIYRLQQKTGLYCTPSVSKTDALIDKKRREDEGITGIIG